MTKPTLDKNWIDLHLFTKNGSLNNRIYRKDWWINRGFDAFWEQLQPNVFQNLYHIYNHITEIPKCKCGCGKEVEFLQFKSGYRDYASMECVWKSDERNKKISNNRDMASILEKVANTNQQKYGVSSYFQTEEFKQKSKATKIERYGDENYANKPKALQTNLEKYGSLTSTNFKEHPKNLLWMNLWI